MNPITAYRVTDYSKITSTPENAGVLNTNFVLKIQKLKPNSDTKAWSWEHRQIPGVVNGVIDYSSGELIQGDSILSGSSVTFEDDGRTMIITAGLPDSSYQLGMWYSVSVVVDGESALLGVFQVLTDTPDIPTANPLVNGLAEFRTDVDFKPNPTDNNTSYKVIFESAGEFDNPAGGPKTLRTRKQKLAHEFFDSSGNENSSFVLSSEEDFKKGAYLAITSLETSVTGSGNLETFFCAKADRLWRNAIVEVGNSGDEDFEVVRIIDTNDQLKHNRLAAVFQYAHAVGTAVKVRSSASWDIAVDSSAIKPNSDEAVILGLQNVFLGNYQKHIKASIGANIGHYGGYELRNSTPPFYAIFNQTLRSDVPNIAIEPAEFELVNSVATSTTQITTQNGTPASAFHNSAVLTYSGTLGAVTRGLVKIGSNNARYMSYAQVTSQTSNTITVNLETRTPLGTYNLQACVTRFVVSPFSVGTVDIPLFSDSAGTTPSIGTIQAGDYIWIGTINANAQQVRVISVNSVNNTIRVNLKTGISAGLPLPVTKIGKFKIKMFNMPTDPSELASGDLFLYSDGVTGSKQVRLKD